MTPKGKLLKLVQQSEPKEDYAQPIFSPDSQRVAFKCFTEDKDNNVKSVNAIVFFSPKGREMSRIPIPSVLERKTKTEKADVTEK